VKAKTKILIALILLSVTTIVLVCPFIGCQKRSATSLQQPVEQPIERSETITDSKKPDSDYITWAEVSTESSQQKQDVYLDENRIPIPRAIVKSNEEELSIGMMESEISATPLPVASTPTADPQDINLSKKPESQESSRLNVLSGRRLTEELLMENGVAAGKDVVTYGWDGRVSGTYGGGMAGGMGGMGGYGGGMGGMDGYGHIRQPGYVPSSLSNARENVMYLDRTRGPSPVRQMPVELLNVTADEVWVVAKAETQAVAVDEDTPGSGAMLAKLPEEEKEIPLPLKHTDVKGQISGYIATVDVTQQFHNPYDEKIEAVYVFPLPQNAAINEFIMTIGERRIRGIIRDRKEAEQIYQQAKRQGHVASLLTQERPNIFTQKVANIEPGKQIDVNIKYFNTLTYMDGWYEFVFPMVVGPRFNPPGCTDGVGAVARGKGGISGQKTEVQYLKPN